MTLESRRTFLGQSAALAGGLLLPALPGARRLLAADPSKPPKIAVLITTFFFKSHAHVIMENFVQPYLFNGQVTQPGVQVTGLFVDQVHAKDMSRDLSKQFQIPIYPTIAETPCAGGKSWPSTACC